MICKASALTGRDQDGTGNPVPSPIFIRFRSQPTRRCAIISRMDDILRALGLVSELRTIPNAAACRTDPRIMFREAVELILMAWSAPEPFDWNGTVWHGKKWHIIPKPLNDIEVGIACSRTDTTLELTAEKASCLL